MSDCNQTQATKPVQQLNTNMSIVLSTSSSFNVKFVPLLLGIRTSAIAALGQSNYDKDDDNRNKTNPEKFSTDLSVVMVFVFGLVLKMIQRYRHAIDNAVDNAVGQGAGQSNLVFLLNRLKMGALPITELSREDVRATIEELLGVQFIAWDKFDGVCNIISNAGFLHVTCFLTAFRSLPPLVHWLPYPDSAQVVLMLMTMCSEYWVRDLEALEEQKKKRENEMKELGGEIEGRDDEEDEMEGQDSNIQEIEKEFMLILVSP